MYRILSVVLLLLTRPHEFCMNIIMYFAWTMTKDNVACENYVCTNRCCVVVPDNNYNIMCNCMCNSQERRGYVHTAIIIVCNA